MTPRVRPAVILLVVAATSLLLAGCGHRSKPAAVARPMAANAPAATSSTTVGAPTPPTSTSPAPAQWTLVATTHGAIPSFRFPGGPRTGTVPATWHLAVSTLPVIATRPGWLEVRLAQRPNGSTAWVLASDVTLARTPYRIVIDLATTHLMLYRAGQLIMSVPVGIGTSTDPTPVGQYFLAFLAAPPTPGYGAFVMVTSAHSNTITDWESSGDAMIAIHGPLGSDSQIGTSGAQVSHGCVRLHESDLAAAPPGTGRQPDRHRRNLTSRRPADLPSSPVVVGGSRPSTSRRRNDLTTFGTSRHLWRKMYAWCTSSSKGGAEATKVGVGRSGTAGTTGAYDGRGDGQITGWTDATS